MSFDASLPEVFSTSWRKALRNESETDSAPRRTSYQAPGLEPVPFVLEKTNISGGQSNDLSEYPAFGGWSSESLNILPQKIKITGNLTGENYIADRTALIAALNIATSDDKPGYLVLPFWGRFAVNIDTWDVDEETKAQGSCNVSITFIRVGQTDAARITAPAALSLTDAVNNLKTSSVGAFAAALTDEHLSVSTLTSGFTKMKESMIGIIGRVQGVQSLLNDLTNQAMSIINLIDQGIHSPQQLALALFGCVSSIVAGILSIGNSVTSFFSEDSDSGGMAYTAQNVKNVALLFLSNRNYSLDSIEPATTKELDTKTAMVALYRQACFAGAAALLPSIEAVSANKVGTLYELFERHEAALDLSDPDVYQTVVALRILVAESLAENNLLVELQQELNLSQPMLVLAHALGVSYEQMIALNSGHDDDFFIKGTVSYV